MRISRPVIASVVALGAMSAAGFAAGAVEDPEVAPPVVETAELPHSTINPNAVRSDTEQPDDAQPGAPRP
ncbi:hypothetical protein [Dietzia aurantiaca]|uniref:Uncharacterized protein n=1 Tax=Dietzia aurantiaca TaxID=983873 RepID=A0ABV9PR16_9ACTN